jgi:hypothetical protein
LWGNLKDEVCKKNTEAALRGKIYEDKFWEFLRKNYFG